MLKNGQKLFWKGAVAVVLVGIISKLPIIKLYLYYHKRTVVLVTKKIVIAEKILICFILNYSLFMKCFTYLCSLNMN